MGKLNYMLLKNFLGVVLLSLLFVGCSSNEESRSQEEIDETPPNIVLIISDDQSWTDYSFMGHPHIETPNIDGLAEESLTFTRGYLAAPLCRPSLATLATGLFPHQHRVTGNDPEFSFDGQRYGQEWMLERAEQNKPITQNFLEIPNLPTLLGQAGYRSFQTGKWWEGSWKDAGFTEGMTHGDPSRGGRHGDDGLDIGREGMEPISNFIDTSMEAEQPFFLWYAPFMPHTPHTPPDSLLEKYIDRAPSEPVARYWAMCEWFDQTVGELQNILDQRGLTENTLIVYVADNGWAQNPEEANRYLTGSKQAPYELGIRTPIMYKWPGHTNARMDTTSFVSSTDIVPTILAAAGVEGPSNLPGINILNSPDRRDRTTVYSEDFTHDMIDPKVPGKSLEHRVILQRPWKLIVPGDEQLPDKPLELFNVMDDPGETQNLADEHPELVDRLQARLNQWWEPED
ncbi:sulfatase [Halalkalibaculum sp. DA3122]|uniref:sulfatase family protein n=1 Tax=Halalkalibaculum sp. DA3122 TaxID=3373607 RepID=UPI00375528ED